MATQFGASGLLAVNKPLFMKSTSLVYAVKSGLQLAHSEEHGSPIHFKKIKCGDQNHPQPTHPTQCTRIPIPRVRVFGDGQLCTPVIGLVPVCFFDGVQPCVRACVCPFVRSCTILALSAVTLASSLFPTNPHCCWDPPPYIYIYYVYATALLHDAMCSSARHTPEPERSS